MTLPTFQEWLTLRLEMGPAGPGAPDPATIAASQAVKAKLQNPDPKTPLAAQARTALGQAAAAAPNPMAIAKLDEPEENPAGPGGGPTAPGQRMSKKMRK